MDQMVLGIFHEQDQAEDAISKLESQGYHPNDFSIVMKDRHQAQELSDKTGTDVVGSAVSGAGTGAAASTVSGAATGAAAGGLIGALTGLGLSDEDARFYETQINDGGILFAVPVTDTQVDEVQSIMQDTGADQIRVVDSTPPTKASRHRAEEQHFTPTYASEIRRSEKKDDDDDII